MITASLLYNHLTCPHRVAMDGFADPALRDTVNPFVRMLWERGSLFEQDTIRGLGQPFTDLSGFCGDEKEKETRAAISRSDVLIYAGRLSADEVLGEPDLLRREGNGYVAIDIKSGAGKAGGDGDADEEGRLKRPYGVQIALYTDILLRLGWAAGRYGFIWDIHGRETRYDLDTLLGPKSPSIWQIYLEARAEVSRTLSREAQTLPASASACKLCVWRSSCLAELKARQDLTLLPELGRAKRIALADRFPTLHDLANANVERFVHGKKTDFPGIGPATLRKLKMRAELAIDKSPMPFLTQKFQWPVAPVELFFDIETDPMRDLCYLHGFVICEAANIGVERFEGIFAQEPTAASEREAFGAAMTIFRMYPAATVVHYSKYERTEYRKLQLKYPDIATAEEIEALFAAPRAIDLYFDVVKPGSEWPTMDFSIKSIAKFCGFSWRDQDPSGAASIQWFDQWVKTRDPALRQRLLEYNEDDCRAMKVVVDRMKVMRERL
jgi:predicted RecB family nuclease